MINKKDVKDMYFLSPMQEGILFHYLLDKKSPAYFEQTSYRINGHLDHLLFEQSFNRLIERYDVLRTIFVHEKVKRPVQVVLKRRETSVYYEDISSLKGDELERAIKEFKIKDRKRGFDLEKDILIRLAILKIADNKYEIIWSFHHILMDGWCISILIKNMLLIYHSLIKGENVKLPPAAPYMHYIKWLEKQDKEAGINYWRVYLEDYENQAVIPRCEVRKPVKDEHEAYRFTLYREFAKEFIRISNENKVTMSTIIQALWGILLQKYNNTDDVVFGAIVSGRPANLADVETMVGLFINAIPLRVKSEPGETFVGLVKKIQGQMIQVRSYEYLPLAEIQSQSLLKQELINHLFIFENYPVAKEVKNSMGDNLSFFSVERVDTFEQTNYDLSVSSVFLEELIIDITYNAAVYDDSVIKRIESHLERISEQITAGKAGEIPLEEIEIISPAEKNQIIFEFNRTEAEYSKNKTIHQLFEEQVKKTPDHIAVVGPGQTWATRTNTDNNVGAGSQTCPITLSYNELNEQSDRLACLLIEKGIQADSIVGIMMERSIEMIIGIFGILKSGGAYLPIDPDYPQERIDYMLKDSGAKIMIERAEERKSRRAEFVFSCFSPAFPLPRFLASDSSNIAYIIYTSGSTGNPKGVIVEHASAVNLLFAMQALYPFTSGDTYLLKTSYLFDVSVTELFGWYMGGGGLAILEKGGEKDPQVISEWIEWHHVTHINFVPSMFNAFASQLDSNNINDISSLKYIFLAGEALLPEFVKKFHNLNAPIRLENIYGPTEGTVYSSSFSLADWSDNGNIPIGKPIPNIRLCIFDKNNRLQPPGIVGELTIAGAGLARGYLNRPELTAEKFNKDLCDYQDNQDEKNKSFAGGKGGLFQKPPLVYKTGDLARWLLDGNIEFLGRIDHQVKIRGFRIELGEIEIQLSKHVNIKEAVVLAQEGERGDKYLCAYFVPAGKGEYDIQEMQQYLSKELPDYMIPSYFVPLEKIPLNPNGKIDRKALPKPELKAGEIYTAPRNEIEKKLVRFWAEILSRDPLYASQLHTSIGIDDNFFQLGGHSLKATVLASRVHKELNVVLPLAEIFKTPTIRRLSEYIRVMLKDIYESILPAEEKEYYVLSFAQKRMYILQQIDLNNTAYNMPQIVPLVEEVNIDRLDESFRKLIARHDSLRTSFHMIGEQPVQRIHEHVEFKIEYYNVAAKNAKGREDEKIYHSSFLNTPNDFIRAFDLSKAPLLRVGLVRSESDKYLLMVDMHHIISDGVSQLVLREDFMALYDGRELPPLRIQYKDFAKWQNSQEEVDRIHQQMEYWLKEFQGEIPVLEIPTDYPRPISQSFEGDRIKFEISDEETRALNAVALQGGSTLFMVLAAAFNILLSLLSSREDIIVGTTVAGRRHADLEKIIGIFVNTLILRNFPIGDRTFKEFLADIKERVMLAFENQEYPFEMLVEKLSVKRDMGRNPLFDVMFVLQNMDNNIVPDGPGEKTSFETAPSIQPDFPREYENIVRTAQFDLTLTAQERNGRLFLFFQYCTKLFKKETIERLIVYFKKIVSMAAKTPGIRLREIDVISEVEKKKILYEFNDTAAEYPKDKTIHQLFEEQASRTPDHIVVVGATAVETLRATSLQITYRQLNEQSGRLAGLLIEKGVLADSVVGIMMERSVEMIIGIIGILKSGGAYMPIDPEYPPERVNYMVRDSGAAILLTDNEKEIIVNSQLLIVNCKLKSSPRAPLHHSSFIIHQSNLSYIIYTSGTTGRPKGSLIEHRNVVRLLFNDKFQFHFSDRDVWTLFHSFCFDFSVWEMYGALLYGGRLTIVPKMVSRDPREFLGVLKREQVTILNQTPSAFYNLVEEEIKSNREELNIRYVIFGGEALKPVKLRKWKEKYPGTRLINMFGITETTVHVTYKEIGDNEIDFNISNIGVPIPTTTTYVVDRYFNLAPLGVAGELCVGGEGVARGYLNQPELTAEKFKHDLWDNRDNHDEKNKSKVINKSFAGVQGGLFQKPSLVYRSGDLARLLSNGEMEYLGRIDHQVQLKGFRVELGEIENCLLRFERINEAVVIAKENDDGGYRYLCAYIVPNGDIDITELRESLARTLPDYMIPQYFVLLENIPLTVNGKVDRSKLPEPGLNIASGGEYMAPVDKTQEKLVEIWRQVLQLDRVGIYDNYFNLGGDSIKAIALINAINSEFQSNLKIVDIYMNQTIDGLSLKLKEEGSRQGEEDKFADLLPEFEEFKNRIMKIVDDPGNIEDIFPMSDIEKGMVYHYIKDAGTAVYHDQPVYQMVYRDFDIERMRLAFGLMMEKHPILRTAYIQEEFAHLVYKKVPMDIPYYDISGKDKADQEAFIVRCMVESRNRPFDVRVAPLWRMSIFNTGINDRRVFLWEFHHSIIDGWSNATLLTELNNTYLELKNNPGYVPKKLQSGYSEYILQQLAEKRNPETADYWKNELYDYKRLNFPGPIAIKTDEIKEKNEIKSVFSKLGNERRKKLEDIATSYKTTLKQLCFAAFTMMLSMLSYENDIMVGLVTNNRPISEDGNRIIGCFLNTVPVRVKIPTSTHARWCDLIQAVDKKMLELKKYDRLPFFEIVSYLGEKTGEQNPLIDTAFNFIDFYAFRQLQVEETIDSSDNDSRLRLESFEKTNFPFSLIIIAFMGGFLARFDFFPGVLSEAYVHRLAGYFERILDEFINNPEGMLDRDALMSAEEMQEILYGFNNTEAEYPGDKTIHWLFEEQALKTPDHIAVVGRGQMLSRTNTENINNVETLRPTSLQQITYGQLNRQSDRLAGLLIAKGVLPDNIVAIMIERSIEMIVGILGVLKSCGAYLPIDPEYPIERVNYMLRDSAARILINKSEIRNPKSGKNSNDQNKNRNFEIPFVLNFEYLNFEFVSSFDIRASNFNSSNLAYAIYTSGTTGRPKGVLIRHKSFVNLVYFHRSVFKEDQDSRMSQVANPAFDAMGFEVWPCLLSGAALHIADNEIRLSPEQMRDWLIRRGITISFQPTVMVEHLLELWWPHEGVMLKSLRAAGDKLNSYPARAYPFKLYNLYGPTEDTVWTTWTLVETTSDSNPQRSPVIGKPVASHQVYILNSDLKLQPVGVPGELCIGGAGLAQGYLNNPELTEMRFLRNYRSYRSYETYTCYKTGDLARWLPDGNIEFLGRIDQQVKIRGFRVELGEIEKRLSNYPGIKGAVVSAREEDGGDKYLCAYIISARECDEAGLREYLAKELPEYMIPSYFVRLEKIPLTPNGKIDRKALPKPGLKSDDSYTAPRNEIEKKLVEVWSEILGRDESHVLQLRGSIGIHDNFFWMGGHSLKATIMVSRIERAFNVKIPLSEIFKHPKISELSGYIKAAAQDKYEHIGLAEKKEYYLLSSAQKRLYFLQQMDKCNTAYNITSIMILAGLVDKDKLEQALKKLIRRHESLRTSFAIIGEEPVQTIHEQVEFEIEYKNSSTDYTDSTDEKDNRLHHFIRAFDLSKAPLLRVGLIEIEKDRHIFLVDLHHIISDGMSSQVLIQDFSAFYAGKELAEIKLQYKDYAEWQNRERLNKKVLGQGEYWEKEFEGEIPVLELPTDYARPVIKSFEGNRIMFEVDSQISGSLKVFAMDSGATIYIVLVALYNILLSKLTGQEDIVIGSPVAGRRHADLEKIIGMFVNTLTLRNYPSGEKKFVDFLGEVKERTLEAFENQEYQYENLVEMVAVVRDISRNPLFDAMFTLQNTSSQKIELAGLNLLPYESENKTSKFDLTLTGVEVEEKLQLILEYSTKLFREETVQRFAVYFINIIQGVIENNWKKISDFEIITEAEKKRILYDFNNTESVYPKNKTIHRLFAEQVGRTPDHIAVFGHGQTRTKEEEKMHLSYRQLNEQSGQLAEVLIDKGVQADAIVGIMMERSIEMIIGILGILKSGGAYLPIDPEYPQERIDYMLKDSAAKMMIGRAEERKSGRAEFVFSCFFLASSLPRFLASDSSNLAYIIYTSGTTGRPKGVMIDHESIFNTIYWRQQEYKLKPGDRSLQLFSFAFDGFLTSFFSPIVSGAMVVQLRSEEIKNVVNIKDTITTMGITHFICVPSLYRSLLEICTGKELLSLKTVTLAGEQVQTDIVEKSKRLHASLEICNEYGPTEGSVVATFCRDVHPGGVITIGKPIANAGVYIIDRYDKLNPIGIAGQLAICGEGLARGYLNQPELTIEKFNRYYRSYKTNILYKTGDLARWLEDPAAQEGAGAYIIEFLGRIDSQVKIRGFRIELGEIESRLLEIEHVKQACVIDRQRKSGEKYLCAYFVAEQPIDPAGIRNTLAKNLPDYMVPLQFISIEAIPLTPNGKVDKRALLTITSDSGAVIGRDFIAPKSNTEKIIARILEEVLELEKIGVTDNFFEIGGTSLDIIRVTNRLKEALNRDIPMVHIFQYPNIGALAEYFDREERDNGFVGDDRLEAVARGKQDRMRRLQKKRGESK